MKQNPIVELEIDSLAFGGNGVARSEGAVYFIKFAVPGDKVTAMITRKKKSYREGIIEKVLDPSKHRVDAPCKYFGNCGGCSWQNVEYGEQVNQKKQIVLDSLIRIGKLDIEKISEPIASPLLYKYRNKMEFSFSASRWLTKDEIAQE